MAARENAARNGITNAEFEAGDVAALFEPLLRRKRADAAAGVADGGGGGGAAAAAGQFAPRSTCVVIDPPRKGCVRLVSVCSRGAVASRRESYGSRDGVGNEFAKTVREDSSPPPAFATRSPSRERVDDDTHTRSENDRSLRLTQPEF